MKWWRKARAWLSDPGSALSRRVAHGGVWVFFINGLDRLLQLVRTVVLARLLAPEDFGLFGITMVALSGLERLTQTGFDTALIQKKDLTRDDLDTVWVIQIARGVGLAAILFGLAPHISSFFDEPGATLLMRALGITAIVSGLRNVGVVYFRKKIEFHKEFVLKLAGTVPDLLAAIVAALILRDAWALVIGLLAGEIVRSITSYLVHHFRPRPRFNLDRARDLFDFGKYITSQSILLFLLTEGDDVFVGKVLGAASLGLYQIAYRISNAAAKVTHGISKVSFPAYAQLQDRPERLNRGFLRTLGLTTFLSLPVAGAVGVLGPEIVRVFLGEKWMPMVPSMQILCVFGGLRSIGASFGPLFRAVARVDAEMRAALLQLGILAAVVYPLTNAWGLAGVSAAVTLAMVASLLYTSLQVSVITGLPLRRIFAPVLPPAVGVLGAGAVVEVLGAISPSLGTPEADLALGLGAGGLVYLLLAVSVYRCAGYGLEDLKDVTAPMLDEAD